MLRRLVLSLSIALLSLPSPAVAAGSGWMDEFINGASLTAQVAAAAVAGSSTPSLNSLASGGDLNTQDLIAITRPAIVRILTHISGTSTVPAPSIDFETLAVSPAASGNILSVAYDNYITGSGFIVSPDGYILTAAHVVGDSAVQIKLAAAKTLDILYAKLASLTAQEKAQLNAHTDQKQAGQQLAINMINYFRQRMTPFKVSSIVILPATSTAEIQGSAFINQVQNSAASASLQDVQKIFASGVPLSVVAENKKYIDDEKDVALVRVAELNLPTMRLGDSDAVEIAQNIFVFGYPGTADYSGIVSNPSFTSGTVSALKDSTLQAFKYLQTDAKISSGSSGGPIFDSNGAAIGIVVKATPIQAGEVGDTFAFALPINVAKSFLSEHGVSLTYSDDYTGHFLAGLSLQGQKHCKDAISEFDTAEKSNSVFGNLDSYVSPHTTACAALVASGQSVDTIFDEARAWFQGEGMVFWSVFGLALVAVVIGATFIVKLLRRLKKEESLIAGLKEQGQSAVAQPVSAATTTTPSATPVVMVQHAPAPALKPQADPQVLDYVMNSRKAGIPDEKIQSALMGGGWDPAKISAALARS